MKNYFKDQLEKHFYTSSSNLSLGFLRFFFYTYLFLILNNINNYLSFSNLPNEFWFPVGLYSFLKKSPFTYSQLVTLFYILKFSVLLCAIGFKTRFFTCVSFILSLLIIGYIHCFKSVSLFLPVPIILITFVFSISKCGDGLSIDNFLKNKSLLLIKSFDYTWPLFLMKIIFVGVFFSAGISKMLVLGLDWFMTDFFQIMLLTATYTHFDTYFRFIFNLQLNRIFANNLLICQISAGLVLAAELLCPLVLFYKKSIPYIVIILFLMQIGAFFILFIDTSFSLITFLVWLPWDKFVDYLINKRVINATLLKLN